jgi:SAM-dependent methyltransferase
LKITVTMAITGTGLPLKRSTAQAGLVADRSRAPSAAGNPDLVGRHYDEIFGLEVSRLEKWSPVEYRMTLRYLSRYLPDGAVVAEVGVGGGLYSEHMLRRGCTLHLVDVSQKLIESATAHLREQGLLGGVASVTHASATDMAFLQAATMDAVLYLGPLYHLSSLDQRQAAVAEANRILKPGGLLFAAGINRLAYLRDMFRPIDIAGMEDMVEKIQGLFRRELRERTFPAEYLATGCLDPKHAPPIGYAHMTTVEEFRRLFEHDFEELQLIGLESFTSPAPDHLNGEPAEDQELWLDLVEVTGATFDGLAYSDHFLYIGRKHRI